MHHTDAPFTLAVRDELTWTVRETVVSTGFGVRSALPV